MTCRTCRFWEDKDFRLQPNGNKSPDDSRNQDGGLCHQKAPVPLNNWRAFPTTLESDWCGKWQQGKADTIPNEEAFVASVTATESAPVILPVPEPVVAEELKPSFLESFKKRGRPKKSPASD